MAENSPYKSSVSEYLDKNITPEKVNFFLKDIFKVGLNPISRDEAISNNKRIDKRYPLYVIFFDEVIIIGVIHPPKNIQIMGFAYNRETGVKEDPELPLGYYYFYDKEVQPIYPLSKKYYINESESESEGGRRRRRTRTSKKAKRSKRSKRTHSRRYE
jgi:hypothetical protein